MKVIPIAVGLAILIMLNGCGGDKQALSKNQGNSPNDQDLTAVLADTSMLRLGAATQGTINYQEANSITVLVNKQNDLPADYVPSDLVYVDIPFTFSEKVEKRMMRREAAEHLAELFAAAKENGVILYGVSGYRSYETQKSLFAYNVQRFGSEEEANRISARPGQSEHQTGLAMDVTSQSVNYGLENSFGDTEEYAWLKENAHHFGFIIRYPEGKEIITEYMYEPWHLRYLGQDLATTLYEEGITYEEYLFFRI
ncbi:MAG: M15 family metallopeptidase [Desulfitobacteriia bacterium]|jgi:D-alanyl-D-alanine carboxypeptidase